MQPLNITETLEAISPSRLSSYRSMFAPSDDLELYGIYCWNEAVANGFSTLLATVEITLRNSFHREFSKRYGNPVGGPNTHWYDDLILSAISTQKINEIRGHYRWRQNAPTPGDIISGMSFGFWKYLLDVNQARDGSSVPLADILTDLLPNHRDKTPIQWAKQANQDKLYSRLETASDMRNRIAHHEPIWKFGALFEERRERHRFQPTQIRNRPINVAQSLDRMKLTYNSCIELLHWLSSYRAADYKSSSTHHKVTYLLTTKAISDYRTFASTKQITLLGMRRMMRARTPLDQILYLRHQGQPVAVILPWMVF